MKVIIMVCMVFIAWMGTPASIGNKVIEPVLLKGGEKCIHLGNISTLVCSCPGQFLPCTPKIVHVDCFSLIVCTMTEINAMFIRRNITGMNNNILPGGP